MPSNVSTRIYKEYARDLYLSPAADAKPRYHIVEIANMIEAKYPELAGHLTEDTILDWAEESRNGEMSWSDLRAIGQTLRVTSENQPEGKPWIEIILDAQREITNLANGAALNLKLAAINYLASHYGKEEFGSPSEALLAFQAANSILVENERRKVPAR
jgi:hypothetical protein